MDELLERWCESRPWGRVLLWCLGSFLAGLAAWGALLRPVDRLCAERQRLLMESVRANEALWPAVRKLPFRSETAEARVLMPFSPLDFQGADATLVHWKPQQNGGELMLDLEWEALPALFSRLAQRDVQIAAFAIAPQDKALRLRLELEHAK
ncbi:MULTISPECIES: HofO [Enterobacter]|uniref:HofO n=1 Tax=Enterobacter cloacae TaxID=550 RepID=A0A330GG10_ENTCL|nr:MULTISPECIES: HofO [Enterobacter cloacae complex]MEC5767581.1 HofO [Enterobacter chengduensis]NBC78343.1 HofO [Enterobacter asburiae]RAZ71539.1 HofO [Enterobacter cloacae]HBM9903451.1 HofO [Enterobacter chengduensis]